MTGGSAAFREGVEEFATLAPEQRQALLMQASARVRELEQHRFRNRKEIDYAIGDLIQKVSAQSFAYMNELIALSESLYTQGRLTDSRVETEIAELDDPVEWFKRFWAATFQSITHAMDDVKRAKGLGLDDLAYRLFVVNERTYLNAKEYLDEKGWDDEFGSTMSFLLNNNLRAAADTPAGQPMPEGQSLS
jgi:hypothetical protein